MGFDIAPLSEEWGSCNVCCGRSQAKRRKKPNPLRENDRKMTKIVLNGEVTEVEAANLLALIESLGLDARKVAVEKNLEIVPKSTYLKTLIADGDRLEIVHFVGGG